MSQTNSLESISIVLVKTSHPGNVGSVARAMKTMGLTDLRLVSPKHNEIHQQPDALALASGAQDVLENVRIYDDLAAALSDKTHAFALSARLRELGPVLMSPEQAALDVQHLFEGEVAARVAFVLGAERTGLSNEELLMCNRQVYIPSNPVYSSLNLSQAAQIICYVLRTVLLRTPEGEESLLPLSRNRLMPRTQNANLASVAAVEHLKEHWLQAMAAVDFLNPSKPKKLIQRLSKMLARTQLEQEEVDMLRGFLSDVIRVSENRLYPHEIARSETRKE